MKLSRYIAMAAFLGFAMTSAANATAISGTLVTGNTGTGSISYWDYDQSISGSLANNEKLTINYTYTNNVLDSVSGNPVIGGSPSPATDTTINGVAETSQNNAGTILASANLGKTSSTVVITNTSGSKITFESIISFAKIAMASFSYSVSAVPLPPAALLFAAALMGLVGFASYKKSRNEI